MFNIDDNGTNPMNDGNNCINDIWLAITSDALTNVYSMLMINNQNSFSSSCVIRDADEEFNYNETMQLND